MRGALLARMGSVGGVRAGVTEWWVRAAAAGGAGKGSTCEALARWRAGEWPQVPLHPPLSAKPLSSVGRYATQSVIAEVFK